MNAGPPWTLGAIAARFGLALRGDADAPVDGVGTLAGAGARQVAFLANPSYRAQVAGSAAAAIVMREADAGSAPGGVLVSGNPYADFARIAALFESRAHPAPGVHPSAVVDPAADVDPSACIGPHCVVGPRARIEAGAELGPGCLVGEDCVVGAQSRLVARVTLVARVVLGRRVLVHPGAVIGADGFGLAPSAEGWIKVPQLGGVRIGDDCEIGANTTIDRGAIEDTVLEEDVRLDNQIQLGHNVRVGAHTAMAGCAAVAGSARIGRWCLIGGGAGIVGHIELCDHVTITAMSMVTHSIREPGEYSSGTPLQARRLWRKNAARFGQLDGLFRRIGTKKQEKADDE
jgi:UDP-3-O-[3-hydroxymyristoyl] glucosamine N-acyltransferase